jgi:hypothetical protein
MAELEKERIERVRIQEEKEEKEMNVCLQNIIQVAESIDKQACKKRYEDEYKTRGSFSLFSSANSCSKNFDPKELACEKHISKYYIRHGWKIDINRSLMKKLNEEHIIIVTTSDSKWKVMTSSDHFK